MNLKYTIILIKVFLWAILFIQMKKVAIIYRVLSKQGTALIILLPSSIISQSNEENVKRSIGIEANNLNQRLSGDDLLNAIDKIEELKNLGAEIDDNGYVTLYHRTDRESAKKIKDTKKMTAKEDGVFFSTSENGTNNSGYGDSVVKVKMPIENLK